MPFEKKIVVITAPSGAGKTSITHYLLRTIPRLSFSVSAATRTCRPNEVHGRDYYFISPQEFQRKIEDHEFAEWEMVYQDNYYGTLKSELERIWSREQIPLLDIDVNGALRIKKKYPDSSLAIFVLPPSVEELKKRLLSRGTESQASLQTRINKATEELSYRDRFDRIVVNDNLDKACQEAANIVQEFIGKD
jgi:guanylate kinase